MYGSVIAEFSHPCKNFKTLESNELKSLEHDIKFNEIWKSWNRNFAWQEINEKNEKVFYGYSFCVDLEIDDKRQVFLNQFPPVFFKNPGAR